MVRCLAIAVFVVGGLALGPAHGACVPFGGDDSGCIPPDSDTYNYESKVNKNLNKYQKCVVKCHQLTASGKVLPGTNEDNCENNCKTKYDTSNSKLTVPPAAACLVTDSVRQFWKGFLDLNNGTMFCDPGTPFGGDDTGNIPADPTVLKCEVKVASNAAKLLKCSSKCHAKRAKGTLADAAAEDLCEDDCRTKFDSKNANLTNCPGCLNTTSLGDNIRSNSDGNNGAIYCAM